MKPFELKFSIIDHTEQYAMSRGLKYKKRKTAIIFDHVADNFIKKSYENIEGNKEWIERLKKKHQNVKGAFEMQSSNSSDALLMNIFCHPNLKSWKGILDLFKVCEIKPKFGINPGVPLKNDRMDMRTEIDLVLGNIFAEAKLTENDFTQADLKKVQNYRDIKKVFNYRELPKLNNKMLHYQIIRNILAAFASKKRHLLICDCRRDDLIESYNTVVSCIKNMDIKKRCGIIFWQDIWNKVGKDLKEFLSEKYGIFTQE